MHNPAALRREYALAGLRRSDLAENPFEQFGTWFGNALAEAIGEPNAMTLSTADASGLPSARTVLLKGYDERGFCFYTNYESRKACELLANPRACLTFFWQNLERQVIIQGDVERVSPVETATYFQSRPRGSRLGALVSAQSEIIPSRSFLEERLAELEGTFVDQEIPLPPNWGGFRVIPQAIEFWQGRPNRLHDRFRYTRTERNWQIDRLSP
ncbi:MAG TPA: pyridoxamine 5'-phosphate oxidase [Chthoniobacterales bacterium]|jgi:pyridoxamine 5'-phosphate oxidase